MKLAKKTIIPALSLFLIAGCTQTPEQIAAKEAARIKAAQQLQVSLAKQCDNETATLMAEYFDPPIARTAEQTADFQKRYTEKVNNPVFQACYKMALENYKMQQEVEQMRYYYGDWRWGRGFCYYCW